MMEEKEVIFTSFDVERSGKVDYEAGKALWLHKKSGRLKRAVTVPTVPNLIK